MTHGFQCAEPFHDVLKLNVHSHSVQKEDN
jgi:hypothetical protein